MPINDSAGASVNLIDKSVRANAAIGFRTGVAIEASRGLSNTPTLISSTDAWVKNFGQPDFNKFGLAQIESYQLAGAGVPQIISRAFTLNTDPSKKKFGCAGISLGDNGISVNWSQGAQSLSPVAEGEANTAALYFKGEGDYCKGGANNNIVVRFSKPSTESAYATAKRVFKVQVYDFNGVSHIDTATDGVLAANPTINDYVVWNESTQTIKLPTPNESKAATPTSVAVTAYVNGKKGESTANSTSVVECVASAINNASGVTGGIVDVVANSNTVKVHSGVDAKSLSVMVTITITGTGSFTAGTTQIPGLGTAVATASGFTLTLATSMELQDAANYVFMGTDTEGWATTYAAYLAETYTVSFSPDDYDGNYNSLQIDNVLNSSKYLVSFTSDEFGDYDIDTDGFLGLHKFGTDLVPNVLEPVEKSAVYANAMMPIAKMNLTKWRCVVFTNLGDVMLPADFNAVINAAGTSTLGLSNIGRTAAFDLTNEQYLVPHNNAFIADFGQYVRSTVNGRRIWGTLAARVAMLLNTNYNNGEEARPPFGLRRGQILCDGVSQDLTGPERKFLADHKINPINGDDGNAYYLWDARTSQLLDSSLSDTSSILSFVFIKFAIYDVIKSFVAEYNDVPTVNDGLRILQSLNETFIAKNYVEEGIVNADHNVLGSDIMRFDYHVRFKGVARFVDVYVTAHSQTQELSISLGGI